MEDVTDRSFRFICKEFGAQMLYTEFVASEAIVRNIKKSMSKLEFFESERPIGIQLYGHNIDAMTESARIAESYNPDLIDINFGCPVKKIATRGAGAGMLQDIPKMVRMTESIVNAVKLPVTVKTRLGWDLDSLVIEDVALRLQDVGIKALTIHGRTRNQLYKGVSDWTLIGKVKNNPNIKIPIIGNGDVDSGHDALEKFNRYGVDAIMIGRATIGKPWIFKEIRHFLENGENSKPLSLPEIVDLAQLQFLKSIEIKGIPRGLYEMRRHFTLYFKGLPDFKNYRMKLVTLNEIHEILATLAEIKIQYSDF
jgi:nifR3 family TIM-barrel protein